MASSDIEPRRLGPALSWAALFAGLVVVHISLLRLPYFWDEAGYYVPAARDLLLTGRIIGAEEALRLGLINEILAPENLMKRARELAGALMENSPASLRATKQLLSDHARAELDVQIEAAVRENAAIRTTADFREGILSFLEKRKPLWSGR